MSIGCFTQSLLVIQSDMRMADKTGWWPVVLGWIQLFGQKGRA